MWKLVACFIVCLLCFPVALSAQNRGISGIVVDADGEPLPGASVSVVGKSDLTTVTDFGGKFSMKVPEGAVLAVKYVGFKTLTVRLKKDQKEALRIVMREEAQELSDIVVTALGISREAKSLGYARQKIDTESLDDVRDPNLLNSLSGKVAGVNIISNGGPMSSTRVEIRGNNSITGNNQPLYVIDGVPILNDMGESDELDFGNAASYISPDDIETIEVLKGANAAALYGSDAANGVILITTKQPKQKGKLGVSYNFNMQFSFLREYPPYQNVYGVQGLPSGNRGYNYYGGSPNNGYEYNPDLPYGIYVYNWEGQNNRSWGLPMLGYDVVGRNNEIRSYSPGKDVVTELFETTQQITNNVSIDKKFNDGSLRLSYTNIQYDGILKNYSEMNRHNFSINATSKLANWADVNLTVNYQLEKADNREYKNNSSRNPLYSILNMPRDAVISELLPYKDENGKPLSFGSNSFNNPYWLINEISNGDDRNNFRGNVTFNIFPVKGFNLRLRGSMEKNNRKGWSFTNYNTQWDIDGGYSTFEDTSSSYNYEAVLSYKTTLKGKLKGMSINANVGAALQQQEWDKVTNYVDQLAVADVKALSNNASVLRAYQSHTGKEKQGVFGTVSVGYKGMFLDGTFRNDWSSTLPKNNNSYFYYSGSFSAVLTDMFPSIKSKVLSFAKLRGSYARVGNDAGFDRLINGYTYGGLIYNNMAWFQGENVKKNPNLKPETTISKEIGLEVRLWKDRIVADITYYNKSTRDQIINSALSYLSKYQNMVINSGEVSNKGWEISLTAVPVRIGKNFEWKTTVNWSKNNSMVESLPDGIDKIAIGGGICNTTTYAEVGKPYGAMYTKTYKRNELGQILCTDDAAPKEDPEYIYIGTVQADWRGGWQNTFRYKRVGLSFSIDFQKGGLLLSESAYRASVDGESVLSLQGRYGEWYSRIVLGEDDAERQGFMKTGYGTSSSKYGQFYPDLAREKGVYIPNCVYDDDMGEIAGLPVVGYVKPGNYWRDYTSRDITRFIYDASYIKLREITVYYDLPKKWLAKTPLQSVRVAGVGRNVATLFAHTPKGLDPQATSTTGNGQGFERGFNLPEATYGFDIKVSF